MKAFVIGLVSNQKSFESANQVVEQLKAYNIDATLFPGIDGEKAILRKKKLNLQPFPYSIKTLEVDEDEYLLQYFSQDKLDEFNQKHIYKIYKKEILDEHSIEKIGAPGVMGCFFSHYLLWQKCIELNEPIFIFEDDTKFYREFTEIEWEEILILVLGKTSYLNEPYKTCLEEPTGNPQPKRYPNSSMPGTVGYAIKPKAAKKLVKFYKNYYTSADNAMNQGIVTLEYHNYLMGRHLLDEEGNSSLVKSKDWNHLL